MFRFLSIFLLLTACVPDQEQINAAPKDPIDWMVEKAPEYLNNREFRRSELESSLWMPEIPYAKKRLEAYGLENEGWDLLPEMNFTTHRVGGEARTTEFTNEIPGSKDEWLELGKRVFFDMPMRRDSYIEWLSAKPELWEEVGFQRDGDGNLAGIVRFTDVTGRERMGVTCAVCHTDQGVPGAANHNLDLGKARDLFGKAVGLDFSEGAAWGPGTVDVTDDGIMDPIAIPTLWGLEHQTHINKSGAIALTSPAALAIRFETQYIEGHSMMARPNRVQIWALAMYVYALDSGTERANTSPDGEDLFNRECASCHNPNAGFGGGLILASSINSDPAPAISPMRGTGYFKIPTLIGVSNNGRFMHNARVDTLEGVLKMGHPSGQTLSDTEQQQLIQFLNTL